MAEEDIKNISAAAEDAVTYPLLTQQVSTGGSGGSFGGGLSGVPGGSLTRTAQQTIREVLGWRYRAGDAKGFLAALNKSFTETEIDGHRAWKYAPQTYMLQADLGEITGAQASIHKQATSVLEQVLPLIDALTPLRADVDEEDVSAIRTILRNELHVLTTELGRNGGPRVHRVELLLCELCGAPDGDSETVGGQLGRLRDRLGLQKERVNSLDEEKNLTSFIVVNDCLTSLYRSWAARRQSFARGSNSGLYFGAQMSMLSQVLDVVVEQVHELYDAMDSVFFGASDRQVTEIPIEDDAPITVSELLAWVEEFAVNEGRALLQDAGKDGAVVFYQTALRLSELMDGLVAFMGATGRERVRALRTSRVRALASDLAGYLKSAVQAAGGIERREEIPNVKYEDNLVRYYDASRLPVTEGPSVSAVRYYYVDKETNKEKLTSSLDWLAPGTTIVVRIDGTNLDGQEVKLATNKGDLLPVKIHSASNARQLVAEFTLTEKTRTNDIKLYVGGRTA